MSYAPSLSHTHVVPTKSCLRVSSLADSQVLPRCLRGLPLLPAPWHAPPCVRQRGRPCACGEGGLLPRKLHPRRSLVCSRRMSSRLCAACSMVTSSANRCVEVKCSAGASEMPAEGRVTRACGRSAQQGRGSCSMCPCLPVCPPMLPRGRRAPFLAVPVLDRHRPRCSARCADPAIPSSTG